MKHFKELLDKIDLKKFAHEFQNLETGYFNKDFHYYLECKKQIIEVDFVVWGFVRENGFELADIDVEDLQLEDEFVVYEWNDIDLLDIELILRTKIKELL